MSRVPVHAAALAALLAVAACAPSSPILIGVAGPLSDPVGAPMRLAAELAVREVNAAGGVRGRMLQLVIHDDHGDPDSAVAVAARLRASAVVAVVGHVWSSTTMAAGPIYGGANPIPVVTPSSSAPEVTGIGAHLFRICPTDLAHGAALAEWARTGLGHDRATILYRNEDYGRGVHRTFAATFAQRGGRIVASHPFLDADADIEPYLELLARDGSPQALVVATGRVEALRVLAQARERGVRLPVLGGDALEGIEADGPIAEGLYLSTAWLPDGATPAARRFLEGWGRAYPDAQPPNQPAAGTYDAVHLLAATLTQSGPDRGALQAALATVGSGLPAFEGATGSIGFTPQGDLAREQVGVAVVRNGRLVRVEAQ